MPIFNYFSLLFSQFLCTIFGMIFYGDFLKFVDDFFARNLEKSGQNTVNYENQDEILENILENGKILKIDSKNVENSKKKFGQNDEFYEKKSVNFFETDTKNASKKIYEICRKNNVKILSKTGQNSGNYELPDAEEFVLITRHFPCITLGKNSTENEVFGAENLPIFHSNRGGGATYHDPGQLILYPFLNLKKHGFSIESYIKFLQKWGTDALEKCGINGVFGGVQPGLWMEDKKNEENFSEFFDWKIGQRKKIAFIGLKVQKYWVSHGISFNLRDCEVEKFSHIIPCKSFEKIGKCEIGFDEFLASMISENPLKLPIFVL